MTDKSITFKIPKKMFNSAISQMVKNLSQDKKFEELTEEEKNTKSEENLLNSFYKQIKNLAEDFLRDEFYKENKPDLSFE